MVRRSQLIKDFKAAANNKKNEGRVDGGGAANNDDGKNTNGVTNKVRSILDTERDVVEVGDDDDEKEGDFIDDIANIGQRRDSVVVDDGESDIIDDDGDHEANAQRPL